MYCNKCGKEIPDQTQFCNFCGAKQNPGQPQQTSKASAPAQKKTGLGATILLIVAVAIVIIAVRGCFFDKGSSNTASTNTSTNTSANTSGQSSSVSDSSGTAGSTIDLTSSCAYGALYENDYLIYGAARLYLPSYETLLPGEGNETDYLMYWDQSRIFNANMQLEIGGVSYSGTTEEGMLSSVQSLFSDASMVKFEKTRVNGFQVVRYIIACTNVNGEEQYLGEMIIFPEDPAYETIRFGMVTAKDEGYSCINQTFDTLEISSDFILTYEDTQTMGVGRITVK